MINGQGNAQAVNEIPHIPISNKPMIQINTDALIEKGYLTLTAEKSDFNERFRKMKRQIVNNAFGTQISDPVNDKGNLVMVTSINEGEGKTYTTLNTAFSAMLETDKTVLVIDANVVNPSLYSVMDFDVDVGLIEYLLGEANDVSQIIYNTSIPNLKIIPAGQSSYLTNELLASKRMKTLCDELANRYDDRLVLFDCPQLQGISETNVLATLVGQAVIVTENNKTSIHAINDAIEQLPKQITISAVINKLLTK